ncbi:UDP-N-acetylglucosamine--N-acetylmuramyl-(pentapeptide) pyrophosphoryl-undecaprenol N-acetylglucosamine transferase [Rhodococcus maanshanensis]|uniref:UDP-N-acetylglucosamine--N-acetylmuramyl- (pentapeptide) pyrophosphoryl-undecaprenol N-acetylglucosamine transferase n=1 Tax=Rhodococcus maanshanensis TaxID=183556 RepID=UPI0022B508D1|nr:UDP-N-acetylglucosamine--N-acetylmuramyl-(pentapeptide) pyrophosphoryl-undecaprenol N-acetylglucosamine transferase [Rhodococcus maanshanensis]MCZ4558142.1 UDP-N-acetylglucosamine--N-acetylmuramyl-(pentapeptide) pyrophosphoryl-undecaprenol N-acetylglucosamine transferase [Rhodococcus maanshanensis]
MTFEPRSTLRVAIGAGGTGGHIYPGLAVAEALCEDADIQIDFFGAKGRLEETLVPAAGYRLHTAEVDGLTGLRGSARAATRLVRASAQCARQIRELGIDVVFGTGGYPSLPIVLAARIAGVPTLIHESNAVPGRANRLTALLSSRVAVAFPEAARAFTRNEVRVVGTPLMREIARLDKWAIRDQARTVFGAEPGQKLVVVCGGSLGSRRLTDTALSLARQWRDRDDVRLIVKAGPEHFATASAAVEGLGNVLVLPYLDRMDLVYAGADVFVGRAGAITVAEISHVGVPSVLVPYPHAIGDHQRHNAQALVARGAARMLADGDLSPASLARSIDDLVGDATGRATVEHATHPGMDDSARTVANWIRQLGGHRSARYDVVNA